MNKTTFHRCHRRYTDRELLLKILWILLTPPDFTVEDRMVKKAKKNVEAAMKRLPQPEKKPKKKGK